MCIPIFRFKQICWLSYYENRRMRLHTRYSPVTVDFAFAKPERRAAPRGHANSAEFMRLLTRDQLRYYFRQRLQSKAERACSWADGARHNRSQLSPAPIGPNVIWSSSFSETT